MKSSQTSDCCGGELLTSSGEEGTSCYICSKCKKPCDVKNHQHLKKLDKKSFDESLVLLYEKSLKKDKIFDFYKQSFDVRSGFPHYRRGGWLQLFRMRPYGWEDRGKVSKKNLNYGSYEIELHAYCHTRIHIGIEVNSPEIFFKFCPKCLTKIKE